MFPFFQLCLIFRLHPFPGNRRQIICASSLHSSPLPDWWRNGIALRFLFLLVRRSQIRSICALSSGLCLPPFVAIKSAPLAAGKLYHRRSAAKIVSHSASVSLTIILWNPFLKRSIFYQIA